MEEEQIRHDVKDFFHRFATDIIRQAGADPSAPSEVKMAMIDHFERIYPNFAQTQVFQQCNQTEKEPSMIEAYRENFTLLLQGRIP